MFIVYIGLEYGKKSAKFISCIDGTCNRSDLSVLVMFKINYIFWPSVIALYLSGTFFFKNPVAHLFCFGFIPVVYWRNTRNNHARFVQTQFCQDSAGSCPSVSQVTRAAKKNSKPSMHPSLKTG